MRVHALTLTLGCLLVFAGSSGLARADDEHDVDAGRSHFKSGVDSYRDGDLTTALIEFKRAYAAAPNYRLLYNLGQVSHEMRDYTEAQRYFQQYLKEGAGEIEPARKQEVELVLAKIANRIASVVVSCNLSGAEIFVDDVSVGKSPMGEPVRVSAGTRRISAAISGRQRVTQVVEAGGGDTLVVKLEFAPAVKAEANVAHNDTGAQPAPESSGPSPALWLGIGTGALGVGAGVMAVLAASDSAAYQDALDRPTSSEELASLHDSATTKALVTDILLGATVVGAAVTVWVALDSDSDERAPSAQLSVGAGSVALSGRFQ